MMNTSSLQATPNFYMTNPEIQTDFQKGII